MSSARRPHDDPDRRAAAAVLVALLDAEAETPRGRPRLSREAVAYLRGAADALAAVEAQGVTSKRS
jgi:hypothetical protein